MLCPTKFAMTFEVSVIGGLTTKVSWNVLNYVLSPRDVV